MLYAFCIATSVLIATIFKGIDPKLFWRLGSIFATICNGICMCIAIALNNSIFCWNHVAAGLAGIIAYFLTGLFWSRPGTAS